LTEPPLWSGRLAQPREDAYDDVFAPPPEPEEPPRRDRRLAVATGILAVVAIVLLIVASNLGTSQLRELASSWSGEPMRCTTARFERGDHAFELFACHAVAGGELPPGVYRTPETQWTSDLTRRDAFANVIEISPRGELSGWALY
jgi:hypothetical protein